MAEGERGNTSIFRKLLGSLLVIGPDPIDDGERPGIWRTLFPWPVRLLLVAAAAMIGFVGHAFELGRQLGWALQYGFLVSIAVVADAWKWCLLANVVFAVAWLLFPAGRPREDAWWHRPFHVVTFANRQLGHIEALGVWVTLSLISSHDLRIQLPFMLVVVLLGEPLLDGLVRWRFAAKSSANDYRATVLRRGSLLWTRRPYIYGATLVGQFVFVGLAPSQAGKLVPLILAIGVGDMLRTLRHLLYKRGKRRNAGAGEARQRFRNAQAQVGRHADPWLGQVFVFVLACVAVFGSWRLRQYLYAEQAPQSPRPEMTDGACGTSHGRPEQPTPEVSLFLIADTHMHELGGRRFPGQMEFADALVPVAVRPVELDLLSVATAWRFGTVYDQLVRDRLLKQGPPPLWAHLGDASDLACQNEHDRANRILRERFAPAGLVGLVPGNHDNNFVGNFYWSPYWTEACVSGRMEKIVSDAKLMDAWQSAVQAHGQGASMKPVPVGPLSALYAWIVKRGTALTTVTRLGTVSHHGKQHNLIGVFLDTTDGISSEYGIAGVWGTLSQSQVGHVLEQVKAVRDASDAGQSPLYVLFLHHGFDALTSWARERVEGLIQSLAENGELRVLTLVSAHTHRAAFHGHCSRGRVLPEMVLSSTIDAPQEAALLDIGPDSRGTLTLRLHTVPAVARDGTACGDEPVFAASDCRHVMNDLEASPDCRALFSRHDGSPGSDCQALERSVSLTERLAQVAKLPPDLPGDDLLPEQHRRASALFACICRNHSCEPPLATNQLNDETYTTFVRGLLSAADSDQPNRREKELVCLGWAGAVVQSHKWDGMEMADGLRCAFEDTTIQAPLEMVVRIEALACK